MKLRVSKLSILFAMFSLILMASGCEKKGSLPLEDQVLTVSEIKATGCKENLKSTDVKQSVYLKAVNSTQLQLEFINGSLNCCLGEIQSRAYIEDGILRVNFYEEIPGVCNCICYYDLECLIDSLDKREYTMQIFISGDKLDASFSFEFSENLEMIIQID